MITFYVCVIKKKTLTLTLKLAALAVMILSLIEFQVWEPAVSFNATKYEGIRVPILMYQSILKDATRANKFTLSPKTFEDDMLYLKENGYTAVFVSDLIAYVYDGVPLPNKPVIITLDDGYLNNLTYVLPILEETDMKATISIVGAFAEEFSTHKDPNITYGHLTWDDIETLYDSKRVEIANHSYDLHKQSVRAGTMKKRGESSEVYRKILINDLAKLQASLKQNTGIVPEVFTYPYGLISEEALPIIKQLGFKAALTCYEKVNYITNNPEILLHLNRFNRPSGISTKEFMKKIIE